jgi:hypothetical protein
MLHRVVVVVLSLTWQEYKLTPFESVQFIDVTSAAQFSTTR